MNKVGKFSIELIKECSRARVQDTGIMEIMGVEGEYVHGVLNGRKVTAHVSAIEALWA